MKADMFNQEAIDELSSPEQLDKQIRLISPGTRILHLAVLAGVIAVVIWAVIGTISSGEEYQGVVFDHNDVYRLTAEADGTVKDVLVSEGDMVFEGDIIAVISNEELTAQIAKLRSKQKKTLSGSSKYEALENQIVNINRKMVLRSGSDGVIQSISLKGTSVEKGDCLASIVPQSDYSYKEVYIFVPKEEAGILKVGMEAQITPAYVTREEYGYMEGMISEISENLVTENSVIRHMGTSDYVDELIASHTCVQITIQLGISADGTYQWSNQKGQNLTVESGDRCQVRILTREYHPYELLIES